MNFQSDTDFPNIPKLPGSYVLLLKNPRQQVLSIGRLGPIVFIPGTYAYVGSAMGGLSKRVQRYCKPIRKPHWHIDVLVSRFHPTELWLFPSPIRQECQIARFLSDTRGIPSINGFGSTDCNCPSHLFHFSEMEKAPLFGMIKGALGCEDASEIRYS